MGIALSASRAILNEAVGENLDRLITLDLRGDAFLPKIYAEARRRQGQSLVLAAAEMILGRVDDQHRVVVLLTGFRIPPSGVPETDGVIGTAVLAQTLFRASGVVSVLPCEPEVRPALAAALRSVGLSVGVLGGDEQAHARSADCFLIDYELDTAASDILATIDKLGDIALCAAIERPGQNAQGFYHFAGGTRIQGLISPVDELYAQMRARGVPTIAIGDFGNELGMGVVKEIVAQNIPAGRDCGCGCGGGIANPAEADVTIVCTVSDWGAYALAAMLGHLRERPDVLVTNEVYVRTVHAANLAGAIDGTSRLAIPNIDGISLDYHRMLLEILRGAVAYPNRPAMGNRNRAFTAELRDRA